MIVKQFGKDFDSHGGALTLGSDEVGQHDDGWEITGEIKEDYFEWVNEFTAVHPVYGFVWGDFEDKVYAESEEGFEHFYRHHQPNAWDYWDI